MKKKLISTLVLILLLSNTINVQANTSINTTTDNINTTIVSLDNIKEIMLENNLDMKSADNNLQIAEGNFKFAKENVDEINTSSYSDKKYNEYLESEDYINSDEYTTGAAATFQTALNSEDSSRKTLKEAKVTYQQKVAKYVYQAQSDYVSYLTAVSKRELEENSVKLKERTAETYKLQYENGFLAKTEYTKALQDVTKENSSLSKLKNDEELAKTNLCTELGISSDEKVLFNTDVKSDLNKVSQIKYDDDLNTMLENNFSIQVNNMTLDNLKDDKDDYDDKADDDDTDEDLVDIKDDVYDYQINNAQITLQQSVDTAKSDFKSQYNSLINSYNTMKNNYGSLNQGKNDYSTVQLQYDYGFVSKNDLEDSKIGSGGLDSVNSDYENAKIDFYANYLRYLQMKEGY